MTANKAATKRRRINGDGSVYRRKDGYWAGAFYARTTAGRRKRVVVYGKTLQEARDKLLKAMQQARAGIPVPDQAWRLDLYLEYWLENIVKRNRRPATYNLYEMIVRLYLIPGLGNRRLTSLSVPVVQDFLNQRLEKGDSVRKVQVMRTVLSAALTRAVREELLVRNVARLAELPESKRATIHPWSASEARQFLAAAKDDPLYAAFVVLIFYGLRRGEAIGLRWEDIDFDAGTIRIRQQVQRIRGQLLVAPVKTRASQRGLPLLDVVRQALKVQAERQDAYRADMGRAWPDLGLVFTTRTGRPIEPRNLVRSFRRICDGNKIRIIKVHHLRHTVGSLLKDLHVPPRDVQIILGHTRISTTLEIYTDVDEQAKRDALTQLHGLLDQDDS
ncbi:MAG TPA: tyrosine-type recombinase/integrase [Streptosporangiaceae bacterium]|nr:tyrosine-type recombinase/integrase [Streptosporangiaceae bacterium]